MLTALNDNIFVRAIILQWQWSERIILDHKIHCVAKLYRYSIVCNHFNRRKEQLMANRNATNWMHLFLFGDSEFHCVQAIMPNYSFTCDTLITFAQTWCDHKQNNRTFKHSLECIELGTISFFARSNQFLFLFAV